MKTFSIFWEQKSFDVDLKGKDWITPLSILEQVGEEGRSTFIEILLINYRDQLERERKALNKFKGLSLIP